MKNICNQISSVLYFFRWPPPTYLASTIYVSSDRRISREPVSSCSPDAFIRLSLGIAQIGTPRRVGSKRVTLNFIKNSAYVYARGLLDLVWGYEHLFIVEDPRATSRCRTGIKAPSLDNCLYFFHVSCDLLSHAHSYHILSLYIFFQSLFLEVVWRT